MPWNFLISKGWLDKDGILVSKNVYSGFGDGVDNVTDEPVANVGPIPEGEWSISGPPFDDPEHGPYVLRLYPRVGTQTFGRFGFLIHGDSLEFPGQHKASHGCIIADRVTRTRIWQSGDTALFVLSGIVPAPDSSQDVSI